MEVNSLNAVNQSYASAVAPKPEVPVAQASTAVVEAPILKKRQARLPAKTLGNEEPEIIGDKAMHTMMDRAIIEANKKLAPTKSELHFSVHEVTKDIMVVITNSETGEVIREIPPEKTLDAIAKVWELIGLLVDETS